MAETTVWACRECGLVGADEQCRSCGGTMGQIAESDAITIKPSKPTPGPWTVERVQGMHEAYPEVVGFRVAGAVYRQYPGICEANARLMKEAPMMAERLRSILNVFDHSDSISPYDIQETRALLARLDGEGK